VTITVPSTIKVTKRGQSASPGMRAMIAMARATTGKTAVAIGSVGTLAVALLQLLLRLNVIGFEREVLPLALAIGIVGVWLIMVNHMGRRWANLPGRLGWLGVAVGVAFALQPVMLILAGGAGFWPAIMSNYLLLTASAVVFLVSTGFPVWAIWLGRTLR
jgi:hypothetical protein